jgi:hypothetical protein
MTPPPSLSSRPKWRGLSGEIPPIATPSLRRNGIRRFTVFPGRLIIGLSQRLSSRKERRATEPIEFALAFRLGEPDDDSLLHLDKRLGRKSVLSGPIVELGRRPRATARLAPAAAAPASLPPSEVGKNLEADLRQLACSQFPICSLRIRPRIAVTSSLVIGY